MTKVVIVEDILKRGISLANQLKKLACEDDDVDLDVECICYFCENAEKAQKELDDVINCGNLEFEVKIVNLLNFVSILNEYVYCEEEPHIVLSDYILENDGSEGVPTKMVNIRYARNLLEEGQRKIWMYTGTGSVHESIIKKLLGEDYFISVGKVDSNDQLSLNLTENAPFMNQVRKSKNETKSIVKSL